MIDLKNKIGDECRSLFLPKRVLLREHRASIFDRLEYQNQVFRSTHFLDNDWENKHDNYVSILNEQR